MRATSEIEGIASVLRDSTFVRNRENQRDPSVRSASAST